jgi:hypothetical protein
LIAIVIDTDGKFATGINNTSGKFTTGVVDTSSAPFVANIFANFRKKIKIAPMVKLGAQGKLIYEKNMM